MVGRASLEEVSMSNVGGPTTIATSEFVSAYLVSTSNGRTATIILMVFEEGVDLEYLKSNRTRD